MGDGTVVSVGTGVSDGTAVSEARTGASVDDDVTSGVWDEQEISKRMENAESRLVLNKSEGTCVAACLCMGGF